MHDTPEWHKRYFESRIALTDFGRELLAGNADFARDNKIDRYWGGTRLTSKDLWRWDKDRRGLVR
jgi:hypothetical protein